MNFFPAGVIKWTLLTLTRGLAPGEIVDLDDVEDDDEDLLCVGEFFPDKSKFIGKYIKTLSVES